MPDDCALGISPVTSFSGVKRCVPGSDNLSLFEAVQPLGLDVHKEVA